MTIEIAMLAVQKMYVLFFLFGMVLFASNASSTIRAEKIRTNNRAKRTKKKKTARRPKAQATRGKKIVKRESIPNAKGAKARPLSYEQQREYDAYKIGRDFPGYKTSSNIPL